MTQTMDAAAVGQSGLLQRLTEQLLGRASDHGPGGITPRGKQPVFGPATPVVCAQFLQQPGAQNAVAVFGSLAPLDAHHHPVALDIGNPQMTGLVEAQSRAIDGEQEGAKAPVLAGSKELGQFLAAVNAWPAFGLARAGQAALQILYRPLQHCRVEEPQATDSHVDRAGRAPLTVQTQQIVANLRPTDLLRRAPVMSGQPGNSGNVGLDGAFRVSAQSQILPLLLA